MKDASVLCYSRALLVEKDVARLVQAAVYVADSIWIPQTAVVDPRLPPERAKVLDRRLNELAELGALNRWAVEGDEGSKNHSDHTISVERYGELYEAVMDRLMENRVRFLGDTAGRSFDGITEIVLGRETLWLFALNEELGTDGLLYDQTSSANVAIFMQDLLGRTFLAEGVIAEIALRLNLPDVSHFGISEIEACRKYMPAFRADVMRRLAADGGVPGVTTEDLIARVADAVLEEFFEYAREAVRREIGGNPSRTLQEELWSVAELFLSKSFDALVPEAFFNWGFRKPSGLMSIPPQMLLLEVMNKPNHP